MVTKVSAFRLEKNLTDIIDQHQRRYNFSTATDALKDILTRFQKSQQSRIRKLLEKEPQIERVLLSDFLKPPPPEVQP